MWPAAVETFHLAQNAACTFNKMKEETIPKLSGCFWLHVSLPEMKKRRQLLPLPCQLILHSQLPAKTVPRIKLEKVLPQIEKLKFNLKFLSPRSQDLISR